jgi:hypothetical protein
MKILHFHVTCLFALYAGLLWAGELAPRIAAYKTRDTEIISQLPAGADPMVVDYLQACLTNVVRVGALDDDSANVAITLQDLGTLRLAATKKLSSETSGSDPVREETRAYIEHLQGFIADRYYLPYIARQNELLEMKYFNTKTANTGNFIEGYLNSYFPLTKAVDGRLRDSSPPKPLGISPWEVIARFEPPLAFRGGPEAAIMGALALSHTYFPRFVEGKPEFTKDQSFTVSTLKKAGVRVGAGAGRLDSQTRFLLGAGLQVHALGFWALYDPKGEAWMAGLSTADLSKLKKAIGWFE